jgi:hypothetical protein
VKARDAFDIFLLNNSGVVLDENLKHHLTDTLMSQEIEKNYILGRIEQIDPKRCESELRPLLPSEVFETLAKHEFRQLRDALLGLYKDWLE